MCSKDGKNVIKGRRIEVPASLPKKRPSGRSNWPQDADGKAALKRRCAERKAMGIPKRVSLADAYEAVDELRSAVASALGIDLSRVSPRAVCRMIGAKEGAVLKNKPSGKRVVRVAVHDDIPYVGIAKGGDLFIQRECMARGEAMVYPRSVVRFEKGEDWKRTIDFCESDLDEEEIGDVDLSREGENENATESNSQAEESEEAGEEDSESDDQEDDEQSQSSSPTVA